MWARIYLRLEILKYKRILSFDMQMTMNDCDGIINVVIYGQIMKFVKPV